MKHASARSLERSLTSMPKAFINFNAEAFINFNAEAFTNFSPGLVQPWGNTHDAD